MKKAEAVRTIRDLCHEWRKVSSLPDIPEAEPRSPQSGPASNRTSAAEMWFGEEFGLTWQRYVVS